METIAIYVPDEEAKQFILFKKYYNLFLQMENVGVLDIKWGKFTVNIANSKVQNVTKEEIFKTVDNS